MEYERIEKPFPTQARTHLSESLLQPPFLLRFSVLFRFGGE